MYGGHITNGEGALRGNDMQDWEKSLLRAKIEILINSR